MTERKNRKFVREPALRLFAVELAESKQTIIEHIEGRDYDSRHQLTPTGNEAKRVLMMGTLVEVDNIGTSGNYLRGRIVDPTGTFNVYAGQYQPEALLALSSIAAPCFVAVIGKTSAYKPDDKTTIVSIRPEHIVEVDAKTRDHWIKETTVMTLERVKKSRLPEAEREKYREMCKDALKALVSVPQETNILIDTDPEESALPQPVIEEQQKNGVESIKQKFNSIAETSSKVSHEATNYAGSADTEGSGIKGHTAMETIRNKTRIYSHFPTSENETTPAESHASSCENRIKSEDITSADTATSANDTDGPPGPEKRSPDNATKSQKARIYQQQMSLNYY